MPEGRCEAADDGNIGEVEYRPPSQIDEIDDTAPAQHVQQIAECAAQSEADSTRSDAASEPAATIEENGRAQRRQPDQNKSKPQGRASIQGARVGDVDEAQQAPAGEAATFQPQPHHRLGAQVEYENPNPRDEHVGQTSLRPGTIP